MAVQVRAVTTADFDSSPYAVDKPTGTQEGDLLLLQIHATVEVPDGWITLPRSEFGNSPIFYKIAGASEPSTYTVTVSQSGVITAAIIALYSDDAQPLKIESVTSQYNPSSLDRTWPATTIVATESMICCLGTILGNAATTPAAGFTEHYDAAQPRMYAMTQPMTGAGTVGPFVATGSLERESNCRTIIVAEGTPTPFEGPQYRGRSASLYGSANGSQSVSVPATVEVGDFLLLQICFTTDKTPTLPAGWTPVSLVSGADNLRVYSKIAEAGDVGGTVTATYASGSVDCFMGILAHFSPRGRTIRIDDYAAQTNSSSTNIVFADVTPTVAPSALAYFASRAGNGITEDAQCAERWDIQSGTRDAQAMTQLWFAASAAGTRTATSGSSVASETLAVVLVEVEPTIAAYAVADGYDAAIDELVALDPQPAMRGIEVTRRIHAPNGGVRDEELYAWLEWSALGSVSEYQSVLTQLGLLDALTNRITISLRDEHFTWRRYNGIAVKPQIGVDGEWSQFFPRGVRVLVKFLEVIED